jgi:tetratricopeptide (TPR) repeat protein
MGNVLRQLRMADEAMTAYDRAIAVRPDYAEVHFNRGTLLQQLGKAPAALESYEVALSMNPALTQAHCSRGDVLKALGRLDEALASYNQAIALKRDHAGAHAGRGLALMLLGEPDAALASFDAAIQLRPDSAGMFSSRAQAQAKLGLVAEARASHDQAVLLDPQDAAIHFNRGCFFSDLQEWNAAVESYRTAIALNPDHADAYCNLGHALQEAGQGDAALDSYSRALEINPGLSTAFNNRANLFRSRHQLAEALLDYRRTVALEPNAAEVHYNIAQLALLQGDFKEGWTEYEWRRLIQEALAVGARRPLPVWFGDHDLKGKQILLHAEQGLGDTIQFCRYVKLVADLGSRVTLEVQPPLFDLLGNLDGVAHLILSGEPAPSADCQCSLMSLPGAFRTTLETIPSDVPYLQADPHKVSRWREILGPRTRPRVGLAWSGNPHNRNDHKRSVELAQWIPLLPDECEYFCLQKGIREADRRIMSACGKFTAVESYNANFTDTAALIETLDLVVSVDTSLAHLSGAMGKKTWILLCFLPDWRWLLGRRDTPWYPTATLYRQPVSGDWHSVMAEVRKDLLLSR